MLEAVNLLDRIKNSQEEKVPVVIPELRDQLFQLTLFFNNHSEKISIVHGKSVTTRETPSKL